MLSTQFWVVIWKKYVTRKRHWLLTTLEILMPTVTFLLFIYFMPRYIPEDWEDSSIGDDLDLYQSDIHSYFGFHLIYSPQNEFYNDTISRCSRKIPESSFVNIIGFDSKEELLEYYDNADHSNYMAVIFQGNEEKKLDYIIGTDNFWNRNPLYIKKCLDLAFIEKAHGKDLEQNVSIVRGGFRFHYRWPREYRKIEITALLPPLVVLGFVFLYPSVLKCVVEEKQCGMKELMKMAGMRSWMIWLGWLLYAMTSLIIGIMIVIILLKYFPLAYPILTYTDGSIMFVFLLLYGVAAVAFCFAISSFFSRPSFAITAGIIIWTVSYFIPWAFIEEVLIEERRRSFPWIVKILICLLPNTCLYYGFVSISDYETRNIGLQWTNFYKAGSDIPHELSMLNVYLMFIIDAVLYTLFTFYMDRVNPGKYGVGKSVLYPIYFLVELTKKLFKKGLNSENVPYETFENVEAGDGLQKGIEIENLCKNFSGKLAVDNLNLDIYKNQITILLGHNGAGKTTTMSMITGMLTPTSGRIKFDGKDLKDNMDLLRTSLGMCPQHNLFCREFTVEEHLMFFSMLRGRPPREARLETLAVLEMVKLTEKRYSRVDTLSGGMKRKLSLAIALVGDSNVLVLDEPTAGMDPESRRDVWNLLQKWRENKTILLTTHFMEEADALGDWIAILSNGTLQCYGTPMYLKKKYDTGYHLSLTINGGRDEIDEVMNSVCRHTEEAKFLDSTGNNIVFVLPLEDKMLIADLLVFLEENKRRLHIENISLTITTLKDVFLKAQMESESGATDDNNELLFKAFVATDSNTTSHRTLRTIFGLFRKRLQYYKQKIFMYLLPVFLISMLMLIAFLYISNSEGLFNFERRQSLNLDGYRDTEVYYSGPDNDSSIRQLKAYYKEVVEEYGGRPLEVSDVEEAIQNKSRENIIYVDKYIVAAASFSTSPTAIDIVSHSDLYHADLALNLVTNTLARYYLSRDYSISTTLWSTPDRPYAAESSKFSGEIHWCIAVPLGFLFVLANFIIFPHAEGTTTFKHLQYMSGVTPWCYWIVNFLCDFFFYLIVVLLVLVYFTCMFPLENLFAILFTMLFGCGAGSIPLAYLFSRKESAAGAYGLFLTLGVFLVSILTPLIFLLNPDKVSGDILRIFSLILVPPVSLIFTGLHIFNSRSTSEMWENVGKDFVLMMVGGLLYLIINIMVDFYPFRKGICRLKNLFFNLPKHYSSSHRFTGQRIDNMLIVDNLHKSFQKKHIVKGVSFTLNEGQCLGILGVNGAGKTTTFRMLTSEIIADEGVMYIVENDRHIYSNENQYLEKLGYCPQSDALNLALSARQILSLFAHLRGLNTRIVNVFLKIFELEELADISCADYSGGNKRKLSLAVALLGYPKYVLLDEPTNGVDPSSRRKFWKLVRNIQEIRGVSFILTSHSMVECEALCSYMKIMKAGLFVKEGTIAELKRGIGGFSIKLKLIWTDSLEMKERKKRRERDDETEMKSLNGLNAEGALDGIEQLKSHFVNRYNAEIKDEHSGFLHVYIKDRNKRWSELFKEIEMIKMKNPHLIEDYVISEATLEDVFLSVARS